MEGLPMIASNRIHLAFDGRELLGAVARRRDRYLALDRLPAGPRERSRDVFAPLSFFQPRRSSPRSIHL
jgi:hypothetical protein